MKETFQISGMSCGHCVHAVRQALEQIAGVEVESVEIGSATVTYHSDTVDRTAVVRAIEEEGYPVVQKVSQ